MLEQLLPIKSDSVEFQEDQKNFAVHSFREYVKRERYASHGTGDYVNVVKHFCYWLDIQMITLNAVDESVVQKFLENHVNTCTCPLAKGYYHRPALKIFLKVLRMPHVAIAAAPQRSALPHDALLQEFGDHLSKAHGSSIGTIGLYVRHAKEFMTQVLGDTDVTFRKITITNIEEYIAHKASVYKPETAKSYVTALRVFFRFLRATDRLQNPLDEAVPTVAHRRLSTLPKYIDEMQLKTLLSSFDLKLPLDKRDYAMTHLMATTGIRCGEVAALRLDDINWRDGSISIIETKSRRPDQMPLPAETCEALIVYLQSGRPTTDARNIFVTHVAPLGKPLSTGAISSAIRKAFHRSMPDLPSRGTHALRHTLATRLLRNGASLKEIADILRHRSIETTAIYAKVDTQSLQRVIVPWPEVIL